MLYIELTSSHFLEHSTLDSSLIRLFCGFLVPCDYREIGIAKSGQNEDPTSPVPYLLSYDQQLVYVEGEKMGAIQTQS